MKNKLCQVKTGVELYVISMIFMLSLKAQCRWALAICEKPIGSAMWRSDCQNDWPISDPALSHPSLGGEATFKGTFVQDGEAVPLCRVGVGCNTLYYSLKWGEPHREELFSFCPIA